MILNSEKGSYALGPVMRVYGSFRINATSDPDTIRDGSSHIITVKRVSAGLFRVSIGAGDGFPIPQIPTFQAAEIHQKATPTNLCKAFIVVDTYSRSNRTVDIQVRKLSDNSASDADDNDVISFELIGSISSAGTDPA